MSVFVSEHERVGRYGGYTSTPLRGYNLSSGASVLPGAGCKYIRVQADAGAFVCLGSTSTGTTLTSTNALHIAANSPPEFFAVSTTASIFAMST